MPWGRHEMLDDATERCRLEERVLASERLHDLIFNTIRDAIFYVTHEPDDRIRFASVNHAFLEATGLAESQVVGRFLEEVVPEPSLSRLLEQYRAAIRERGPRTWEEESVHPGGTRWEEVTVVPLLDADGECSGAVGVVHDITERKEAEESIKRAYSMLKAVIESTSDGIFAKDLSGRYVMVNASGAANIAMRPEDIVGKTDFDLFPREDAERFRDGDRQVAEAGETRTYEETAVLLGVPRTLLIAKGPYRDSNGRMIGLVGNSRDITDQKETHKALERSLAALQATLDSTADGILVLDLSRRITNVNQQFLDLWGIQRSTVDESNYEQVLEHVLRQLKDPELCRRSFEQLLTDPALERTDILERSDGRLIERFAHAQRVSGTTVGRVFSYRDITVRVHAESRIRESEARKTAILESALDAVVTIDRNGRIVECNQAMEVMFGYERSSMVGRELAELIVPPALKAVYREALARAATGDEPTVLQRRLEFSAVRADGTEIPVEVSLSSTHSPSDLLYTGFIRDITERKQSEERIRQQVLRAKVLADASRTVGEAGLDLGAVVRAAARWAAEVFHDLSVVRLFSVQHDEPTVACHHVDAALLDRCRALLPDGASFIDREASAQVLRTGTALRVSVTPAQARARLRPDLVDFLPFHEWLIVPLRTSGKTMGLIEVFRFRAAPAYSPEDEAFLQDLADRAALAIANARLYGEAQRAIRLRDDFVMVASHELRTPLTPLKGQLRLVDMFLQSGAISAGPRGAELMRLVHAADQQVNRLTRLVEDMLDVARITTGEMALKRETLDLSEVIRRVVATYRAQAAVAGCDIRLSSDRPVVGRFDRARVEQVVGNLLANALKYGAGRPVGVTVSGQSGQAVVTIRDYGIGISDADQKRLFKRFERAISMEHFGGLGVGLYIARQIVEAHGGHLRLRSTAGEGATFTVELPLDEAGPTPA